MEDGKDNEYRIKLLLKKKTVVLRDKYNQVVNFYAWCALR
jgi:hypothetical protein